jgi:hypothetical protein
MLGIFGFNERKESRVDLIINFSPVGVDNVH